MRFLKSLSTVLICVAVLHAAAQNTTPVKKDSLPVFHADKTNDRLVLQAPLVPDTTFQHLQSDDAFWYANADFKKPPQRSVPQTSFLEFLLQQRWFYNLLWTLIICSFLMVIFLFLWKSEVRLFHKKATPLAAVTENGEPENIFTIAYDEALQNARAQSDFRNAIRLHYLQVLTLLSRKKAIQYKDDFTNSDYLAQLRQTAYYGSFKKLTRHFDYAWYGHFPVTPAAFKTIESDFSTFKRSMGI